jgi:uncharacterized membrane protein HdeD (DUF308 family)
LESYVSLSLIFSALIVLSGLFWIAFSISVSFALKGWGWFLVGGVLELVIGTLLIMHPAVSIKILPFFIGFWLLFGGIMGIGGALHFKSLGGINWGWPLLFGIGTTLFSIILLANPVFAGISIIFMTSFSLITLGVFRVIFGFNFRKIHGNNSDH